MRNRIWKKIRSDSSQKKFFLSIARTNTNQLPPCPTRNTAVASLFGKKTRFSTPSFLTTFSMKKNSVAVEKYFLFVQHIFSSQLENAYTVTHSTATEFFFMLKVVRKEVITCEYEGRHCSNFGFQPKI